MQMHNGWGVLKPIENTVTGQLTQNGRLAFL